jgi:hypothetical protein
MAQQDPKESGLMYIIRDKHGDMVNGKYLKGAMNVLGLCTPVTKDPDEAARFATVEEAQELLPKLNRSPMATWEAVQV